MWCWCTDPDLEPVGLGAEAKLQEVTEVEEVVVEEEDEDKAYFEL